MFRFTFGLIWTAITTVVFAICLFVPGEERNGADMGPFLFIFLSLFEIIGIYLMSIGIKEIIKNIKTKKLGVTCYGIIRNIQLTGASINGRPECKATVEILNPETHLQENIEEIIGFNENKYPVNSYVLCKYYQGDINLEKVISKEEIPANVSYALVEASQPIAATDISISDDREYVTIDGVKYKREY